MKFKVNTVVVLILFVLIKLITPNLINNNHSKDNLNCINTAIASSFKDKTLLVYIADEIKLRELNFGKIFSTNSVILFTSASANETTANIFGDSGITPFNCLLIITSNNDVEIIEMFFKRQASKATFLIIISSASSATNMEILNNLLIFCMEYGITAVAFGVEHEESLTVYHRFPYSASERCGMSTGITNISYCVNQQKTNNSQSMSEMFPKTTRNHFQNCELIVSWMENDINVIDPKLKNNPGIFVSLLNTIAELVNINISYADRNEEYQYEYLTDGSISQQMESLETKCADIAIGRLHVNLVPFDFGPALYKDRLVGCAKKPKLIKVYRKLLTVFSNWSWTFVLIFFIFNSSIIYLFARNETKISYFTAIFQCFGIQVGTSPNTLAQQLPLRIIYATILIYCINIDTIYLGKLNSIFGEPGKTVAVESIADVYDYRYHYILNRYLMKLLHVNDALSQYPGYEKFITIINGTDEDILNSIIGVDQVISPFMLSFVESHSYEMSQLKCMNKNWPYLTLFATYYSRKFNPINPIMYYWSQELIEKGFHLKWKKDILIKRKTYVESDVDKMEALTIKHYHEAFTILIIGWISAFFVLLCESQAERVLKYVQIVREHFNSYIDGFDEIILD